MIKHFLKRILLINIICLLIFFAFSACQKSIIVPEIDDESSTDDQDNNIIIYSYLIVKGSPDIIVDCTPELTIFSDKENVSQMSFSGNGEEWSEWVDYSEGYNKFNIASGLFGTSMSSGMKSIYVRFKDSDGIIFPLIGQEPVCCTFEYQIQELFSIKIDPDEAQVQVGGSHRFIVRGYDLKLNEVPLEPNRVEWTKNCGVGELSPIFGLETKYTAPQLPGARSISAHYGSLSTGAKIYISDGSNQN